MPTLDSNLRDKLATVIGKENADDGARLIAANGARAAIEALAVHMAAPYAHQDAASKLLRNRVRARARQLGDTRHPDGRHEIGRLVEQAAYEHWHRMLFARFLAENDLLIHPEMKVAITLAECAEMAASEGATDGWELAGRYASRMLPQIFRPDDPLLAVRFALDDVRKLEDHLDSLPAELFRASDSLGWCYQFWQARKKKEVNASEVKIGADELPAVTQLFTEPYMVQFLLQNTLGAWWVGAGRALPIEMPYLRLLDDGTPAAGSFAGWPRTAAELKVLDPCCGSGHFLVEAFEILVAFRMAAEGLGAREACDSVLRDNLFGLEIDARCVQIAAFALALTAWTYPGAGGYRPLAAMNVACSGLAISATTEEWERLGGDDVRLRAGMARLWNLFRDAPVLGSLIDPIGGDRDSLFAPNGDELRLLVQQALAAESGDAEVYETHVAAAGIADAAKILAAPHTLVVTNVPYLARLKQSQTLDDYCGRHFAEARADIATVFIARSRKFLSAGGSIAVVSPQNWLFLATYAKFRRALLAEMTWAIAARLGAGAFDGITGEIVNVTLVAMSAFSPDQQHPIAMIDASDGRGAVAKQMALRDVPVTSVRQCDQLRNPDARVIFGESAQGPLLAQYADSYSGQRTGDYPRFSISFWERQGVDAGWTRFASTVDRTCHDGGCSALLLWEDGKGQLARYQAALAASKYASGGWKQGWQAWGKSGVRVSQMGDLPVCLHRGEQFDNNCAVIVPKDPDDLPAIWVFCSSDEYRVAVRQIDSALKVTNATLVKVPFDRARWRAEALRSYPGGLPDPVTAVPSEWCFRGQLNGARDPLQVAVARLLGYRWPSQVPDGVDALADSDGIVCIPPIRGERPAADRVADVLAAGWGKDWHPQTLTDLLAAVGHAGSLQEWLRDDFFKQHCELFNNRPFIWHIWDGHREGFSALVNYHKLDHATLKSLTWTYLGDWIRTQEAESKAGKSGAGDKLAKAKVLQQRLAAILEGEAPLDIFVRWKSIEQQPIGWEPDLDDGVRLNIRPFLTVPTVGGKGAGVLRCKPNIKWGVDRGKNPEGAPWGEDRDNDRHLTLAEKRKARGQT